MDNPTNSPSPTGNEAIAKAISGLQLRSIGPAFMGGRIADIAVHPSQPTTWYVAVGSGGLWKTVNAGVTWQPVFEKQPSYSLGCVAIDPSNPETIWVGTGENVSGRHVAWGDGVYRSRDGGRTWQQMGLPASEHIGKILVDPRDGNVVYVAAEGPLWSAGGERGVYKTTDGGASWTAVLTINDDTGITDLCFDPSNPDTLYAAAYQRRRHVWAFMGGGPSSGLYKTSDGGGNWRQLSEGLPKGDMGKIGLAVSPANPNLVYATIEASEEERGCYRSLDKGESWEKRSSHISGGTGPHYYQVIEASPTNPDLLYQMDVFVHASRDGGKTFSNMETGKEKHSDNHALWIDPTNGNHLLCGTDAGLYETFDHGQSWRHFSNMPVSQFYRVALDNSEPFFNVLGGAQDLGTLFGPSRTLNMDGVRNQDWYVPLGADGYHTGFDPDDPQTAYMEIQVGNIVRYDRRSMEMIDIQPQGAAGDPPERWNWDAPFMVSPHNSRRLYMGSQRLWRSDDRGNSWTAVSADLTRNTLRYDLPFMGRVWSVDDLYDTGAMSQYATLTCISESAVAEGLLYTGSDDGLIQTSSDGGQSWRQCANPPNLPDRAFINDVEASLHDANVVFVAADSHKTGDFTPYLFASDDQGQSWRSIVGDLPNRTIVWGIQQDHVNPNLLFLATEYGLYFTPNGGENWHKLSGGVPTISFRDLKIHRRDGDLVGASFGRGFYVLDDYTPLRGIADGALDGDGHLFPVRDAWWYIPYQPMQSPGQPTLGSSAFRIPNPPFGATFTYYLREAPLTAKKARQAEEKKLREAGSDVAFPGWETLNAEPLEGEPQLLLLVRDAAGEPLRSLPVKAEAGLHRASWDLRLGPPDPIRLKQPEFVEPWSSPPQGALVPPGVYSVELLLLTANGVQPLGEKQSFTVKPVPTDAADADFAPVAAFQRHMFDLARQVAGARVEIGRSEDRLAHMRVAVVQTAVLPPTLLSDIDTARRQLAALKTQLSGDEAHGRLNEPGAPTVEGRLWRLIFGYSDTRQLPTATQQQSLAQAQTGYATVREGLRALIETELPRLEAALSAANAAWTPGRRL